MALELVPVNRDEASLFVERLHRHHGRVAGWRFGVGIAESGELVGVGIAGRPLSRSLDDGWTLEITRVCTDETPNVPSMIYGALTRAARALGYRKVITYTLRREPGTSLVAAGFKVVALVPGRDWTTPTRPRERRSTAQLEAKFRWEK